jgi:UDP-N-acetylglucosamine 3-dehydrogenase
MHMIRAAVVGVGSMGNNHARIYREMDGVELVCVVDQDPATAARVGARYSVPNFTSVEAMLAARKPDLVSLAVPTGLHYAIGSQLIQQDVHLLIEKPIAATVKEGEKLIELASKHGVVLAVGHIERFNPAVMELERRLRDGMAGRIYQVHTQRLGPYPSRIRDAGVVIDLATHDIDLVRWLINDQIVRIHGETLQSINADREDMFNGLMRFGNGAMGVLNVNWMTPTKVRSLTATGARGMFVCNLLSQELTFYENGEVRDGWDALNILYGVSEGNVIGLRLHRHEPLMAELSDFVSAVREQRQPVVTGESALETLRIATQFVCSANVAEAASVESVAN